MLTINAGEPSASDSLDIRDTGNAGSVLLLNDSEVEATAQTAWDRWFGLRLGHGQRGELLKVVHTVNGRIECTMGTGASQAR